MTEHWPEGAEVQIHHHDGTITVAKVGAVVPVSDGLARAFHLRPLTSDEQAEEDRRAAELDAKRAAVAARIPGELARLDALDDPVSRAVLDLHARRPWYAYDTATWWTCTGCDMDGYEAEEPRWPCRTAEAVAGVHGIDLTDAYLFDRPADGSLDLPTPEDQ